MDTDEVLENWSDFGSEVSESESSSEESSSSSSDEETEDDGWQQVAGLQIKQSRNYCCRLCRYVANMNKSVHRCTITGACNAFIYRSCIIISMRYFATYLYLYYRYNPQPSYYPSLSCYTWPTHPTTSQCKSIAVSRAVFYSVCVAVPD